MQKKKKNNGETQQKEGAEKKKSDNGGGKNNVTVVLKADLHCEGCVSKVLKCIRAFDGEASFLGSEIVVLSFCFLGFLFCVMLCFRAFELIKRVFGLCG